MKIIYVLIVLVCIGCKENSSPVKERIRHWLVNDWKTRDSRAKVERIDWVSMNAVTEKSQCLMRVAVMNDSLVEYNQLLKNENLLTINALKNKDQQLAEQSTDRAEMLTERSADIQRRALRLLDAAKTADSTITRDYEAIFGYHIRMGNGKMINDTGNVIMNMRYEIIPADVYLEQLAEKLPS